MTGSGGRVARPIAAVCGAAALALVGAAPGAYAAPAPAAARPASTTTVWAGYAAGGGTYTSVSVSWTQPAAVCDGTETYTTVSAMLDGLTDLTAEETGTAAECTAGRVASYYGYYELYPAPPISYTQPIRPLDVMTASVTTDGRGTFTLTLTDATAGWSRANTGRVTGAALSSAEVLAEVPVGQSSSTTAHSVSFTGAEANGTSLDKFGPKQLTGPGVVVSPITAGHFTVTW